MELKRASLCRTNGLGMNDRKASIPALRAARMITDGTIIPDSDVLQLG